MRLESSVKVGDLVKYVEQSVVQYANPHVGLVTQVDVCMFGDGTVPAGVSVMWLKSGASEVVYEDELLVISEAAVGTAKAIN